MSVLRGTRKKKVEYDWIKLFELCLPDDESFFNIESNALLIDWNKFILVLGSVDKYKINSKFFFLMYIQLIYSHLGLHCLCNN